MNDRYIEACQLYNDVAEAFESFDEELRNMKIIRDQMIEVSSLMAYVKNIGFTKESSNIILNCKALEQYASISTERIVSLESSDAIDVTEKSMFTKFCEKVKLFIAKIMQFLKELFDHVTKKSRLLIENWDMINMDKPVNCVAKQSLLKAVGSVKGIEDFLKKIGVHVSSISFQTYANLEQKVSEFVSSHCRDVMTYDGGSKITIVPDYLKLENQTLAEAGWALADGAKLARLYLQRDRNYSQIGSILNGALNKVTSANFAISDIGHRRVIMNTFGIFNSIYACYAKIQATICKQIIAFYNCLEKTSVVDNTDKQVPQLT